MTKRIICLAFALFLLLSVFPLTIFASETTAQEVVNMSNTTIEEDFKTVYAGNFVVQDFPKNLKKTNCEFISLMEGRSSNGYVELYIYVYNPAQKVIVKETGLDKVSLAFYLDNDASTQNNYSKRDLTLISTYGATKETGSLTNALVLKYKVDLGLDLIKIESDNARAYRLADVELLYEGNTTVEYFVAGQEYKFFNDSKGFLNVSYRNLATIEMDAFHTFYRVDTEGVDRYTDIQSVYFPVPTQLLKTFGGLHSMDLEWYKYVTNPAIVLEDLTVVNNFETNYIQNSSSDFKYSFFFNRFYPSTGLLYDYYTWGYNIDKLSSYITWKPNTGLYNSDYAGYEWKDEVMTSTVGPASDTDYLPIGMVFYSDDVTSFEKVSVFGERILKYIEDKSWDSSMFLFSPTVPQKQTFTVKSKNNSLKVYDICSGWEWLWHDDIYEVDTGEVVEYSKLQNVDLKDLDLLTASEFSKKYLVDVNDVKCETGLCGTCMKCQTSKENYNNCTWFLLRYDTTKYQSYESLVVDNTTGAKSCNSMVFETEVIRNFDMIKIAFEGVGKDGETVLTCFPIGRSPTSFVSDAWNPSEKPVLKIDINEALKNPWEWLEGFLKVVFFVVLVLVVLWIAFKALGLLKRNKTVVKVKMEGRKRK